MLGAMENPHITSLHEKTDFAMHVITRVFIVIAALWFLYVIRDVIALFLIAIIITAALNPIITKVDSHIPLHRTVAVALVYVAFLAGLGGLISFIVPTITKELEVFLADITQIVQNSPMISQFFSVEDVTEQVLGSLSSLASTTAGFLSGVVSTVAVLSMSFYMSLSKDGLKHSLLLITPEAQQIYVASLIDRIQESFGRWVAGQLVTMIFVGVLYYIVLLIFGVPYAPLLAILGGILEIIPYFGPVLAAVPAVIFSVAISPVIAGSVAIGYALINVIENQLLIPKIMNKAVGLNPVLVILALLIGGKVAGVVGLLLAVPIAGALGLFVKDVLEKKIN